GSGRLTVPIAAKAKSILALDSSQPMLDYNARKLKAAGYSNWHTQVADHRHIPAADNSADLVVSGWSICYLGSSNHAGWQDNIRQVMSEIKRVLRPGGTVILFETMGTGAVTPNPPSFLLDYYTMLETEFAFSHSWFRADYAFESLEQAKELAQFFFGDELAEQVEQNNWVTLPECAGMWWKTEQP
ncbi:MAG: class I SAM-dependent methyltransferase, partial [Clostridia bacterium]